MGQGEGDDCIELTFTGVKLSEGRVVRLCYDGLSATHGKFSHGVWFTNSEGTDLKFAISDEAMKALIKLYFEAGGDVSHSAGLSVQDVMAEAVMMSLREDRGSWEVVETHSD